MICISLASKVRDGRSFRWSSVSSIAKELKLSGDITRESYSHYETEIIQLLDYKIHVVTPHVLLEMYLEFFFSSFDIKLEQIFNENSIKILSFTLLRDEFLVYDWNLLVISSLTACYSKFKQSKDPNSLMCHCGSFYMIFKM
eukprot:TRINITY_DN2596_c0_g1_i2.p1 TRINITY_DN2596_c0_g1~~TRINITY_DN2596_c0_g1_i2.p1  ORF type:complete len:142 (+),score=2.99 TRINITY_DN2596_c0_g1_i2:298-723(+)